MQDKLTALNLDTQNLANTKEQRAQLEAQLKIFDLQDQIFAKQRQHIQDLGKEVHELGRQVEEDISSLFTDLIFDPDKVKDPWKRAWDDIKNIAKGALSATIKNKLNFEGKVTKNLFEDGGGLVNIFKGAFGEVAASGQYTFQQKIPYYIASADTAIQQGAVTTQQTWTSALTNVGRR